MEKIEVKALNPLALQEAEKMMVCAARLTQRGEKIKNMEDFIALYNKPYAKSTAEVMVNLPHPTIQKFAVINVVVVGASRRFLAQITRHQNEVKFMSASLQYSDYSGEAGFVIPYELKDTLLEAAYLSECEYAMEEYRKIVEHGGDNDSAGYIAPQGMRNILIISATMYQWRHMIGQRICRRNTSETRYVMLKIWEELFNYAPDLFMPDSTGCFCMRGMCQEGSKSCGDPISREMLPHDILEADFPKYYKEPQI